MARFAIIVNLAGFPICSLYETGIGRTLAPDLTCCASNQKQNDNAEEIVALDTPRFFINSLSHLAQSKAKVILYVVMILSAISIIFWSLIILHV